MFKGLFKSNSNVVLDVAGIIKSAAVDVITDKEEAALKDIQQNTKDMLNNVIMQDPSAEVLKDELQKIHDNIEKVIRIKTDLKSLDYKDIKDFAKVIKEVQKKYEKLGEAIIKNVQTKEKVKEEIKDVTNTAETNAGEKETAKDEATEKTDTADVLEALSATKQDGNVNIVKTAAEDPGGKKYRDQGIKEKLLYVNKIVENLKTSAPVENAGTIPSTVISEGPKSKLMPETRWLTKPDKIVPQKANTPIEREEGEKGKLLADPKVKMPVGEKVVITKVAENSFINFQLKAFNKQAADATVDYTKLNTKPEAEQEAIKKEINEASDKKDTAKIEQIVKEKDIAAANTFLHVRNIFSKTAATDVDGKDKNLAEQNVTGTDINEDDSYTETDADADIDALIDTIVNKK